MKAEDRSQVWNDKLDVIDAALSDYAVIRWFAAKLGVKPRVVAAGGLLWVVCFVFWGFTGELICTIVAYSYPLFASFKAFEDSALGIESASLQVDYWLRYWLAYAFSMLAEGLLYSFLACIPFYHLVRLVYIIWLFLPSTNGAQVLYHWGIAPLLRRYRPALESTLCRLTTEFSGVAAGYTARGVACTASKLQDIMAQELARKAASNEGKASAGLFSARMPEEQKENESPGSAVRRARAASPAPILQRLAKTSPDGAGESGHGAVNAVPSEAISG